MRLAIVCREFPPMSGGIGEAVKVLSEGLSGRGHLCTIVTDRNHQVSNDILEAVSVRASGPDPLFHAVFARNAVRFLRSRWGSFDLVSLHFPECLFVPFFMKPDMLRRAFATVHTSAWGLKAKVYHRARLAELSEAEIADRFAGSTASVAVEKVALSKIPHIAAVSRSIGEELTRGYGIRRVSVIPNGGVPFARSDRLLEQNRDGIPFSCGVFIGSLRGQKGLFRGLEALKLSTKRPPIVFVGNGPLKTRLEAYTRKKRLPATFVGHVDRTALVARLVSSAFFFFPSFYEGHSMAVLEACAAGLPVVAFDNTGVQSSISESNRKLLPENGDLRGMAELMDALADSPSLRASLGKANREFSTRFSSARMVDAYEEWYLQANSFRWD